MKTREVKARRGRVGSLLLGSPLLSLFIFVSSVGAFVSSGHTSAIDNEIVYQTTRSLVHLRPTLDSVDRYWGDAPGSPYRRINGKYVGAYGIGQSIAAAPLYVAARVATSPIEQRRRDVVLRTVTMMTNAILLGATAVVVVRLCQQLGASLTGALTLGLSYSLCTYALPHSKTFFTEPGTALFVALSVLFAFKSAQLRPASSRESFLSGLALGAALLFRSSAGMFVVFVGGYIAFRAAKGGFRRAAIAGSWFAAGVGLMLAILMWSNWWRYGDPFDKGYSAVPFTYPLVRGLFNTYFSSGKSLFLYAPIVGLAVLALPRALRRFPHEVTVVVSLIVANSVLFARGYFWAGDAAWGPRYQQIVLPLFAVLLAPVIDRRRWRRAAVGLSAVGLAVPSLLGTILYFNVLYVKAGSEVGFEPTVSDGGIPRFIEAVQHDMHWQPLIRHAQLVPAAARDTVGLGRPSNAQRGEYQEESFFHYGYYSSVPRIDFWWLWIGPTRSTPLAYGLLLPILLGVMGGWRGLAPNLAERGAEQRVDIEP